MYITSHCIMFKNKVKNMYAVIKTGGKQYNVTTGDVVKIEKIAGEEGKEVVFNEVCNWEGMIGYGDTIIGWVEDIFNVSL